MSLLWSNAQLIFLGMVSLAIAVLAASEVVDAAKSRSVVRVRDDGRTRCKHIGGP